MADKLVKAFDSADKPRLIRQEDVGTFEAEGGRVATPEEIAERTSDARYDKQSTLSKVAGVALAGTPIGPALNLVGGMPLPPDVEAVRHGMLSGSTAGIGPGLIYQGLKQLNPEAATAYKENEELLTAGRPTGTSVGKGIGFVGSMAVGGGAGAASKLIPAAGIGRVGAAAAESGLVRAGEHFLARGGALGRAAAAALPLTVQGGVEGAMFGAADKIGEQLLEDQDHELNGEKLWAMAKDVGSEALHGLAFGAAGGALLGGATSLAGSAIRSGTNVARGLGRIKEIPEALAGKAADVVDAAGAKVAGKIDEAVGEAGGAVRKVEEAANLNHQQEVDAVHEMLTSAADPESAKGRAYDMFFKAAGDKSFAGKWAKEANRRLKPVEDTSMLGGTRGVGEVLARHVMHPGDASTSVVRTFANGTVSDLFEPIRAASEAADHAVGEIAARSNATFGLSDLDALVNKEAAKWDGLGALRHTGDEVRRLGEDIRTAVLEKGYDPEAIPIKEIIDQRRGIDTRVFGDSKALDAKNPIEGLRQFRGALNDRIIMKMDQAASEAGTPGMAREIRMAAHDSQALHIAKDMAEDGAAKAARNRGLSLTDYLAAGATGHIGLAPIAALGNMLLRTRGNAAGGVLLYRLAETGAISKAVRAFDDQIGRTAKGVLAPSHASGNATTGIAEEGVRARALKVISAVHDAQANPEEVAGKLAEHTETISRVAPKVAQGYSKAATQAMAYLVSQMPQPVKLDPLALNQAPLMSNAEAAKIARIGAYSVTPMKFFRDAENGVITPEGVMMARATMPKAFAELQMKTLEAIFAHQKSGKPLPLATRMKASMLLDIDGDASTKMIPFLQKNLAQKSESSPAPAPSNKPVNLPTQPSTYDRIETRGS